MTAVRALAHPSAVRVLANLAAALLFLAAGSVIIAMHHDQDIRNMGGLRKYLPITYAVTLIGGEIDVDALATAAGTIGYEVLTNLGSRYHRVYRAD